MQCLFCGKELALLKRLRGGAEFCSEAHRKEYQDQYEQLALARLIQAKPPTEPAPPLGRKSALIPDAPSAAVDVHGPQNSPKNAPADEAPPARHAAQLDAPRPAKMIEAPVSAQNAKPAEEAGPAPLAGFVGEIVVPAVASFQHAAPLELDRKIAQAPSIPHAETSGLQGGLLPAASVEWNASLRALDYTTRREDRSAEAREFPGTAPVFEMHAGRHSEMHVQTHQPNIEPQPDSAADVMEIVMSPHPPQSASPWIGPPRGFPASPAELGQLARLDFNTIGFAFSDRPASAPASTTQASVLTQDPPQEDPPQIVEPVQAELPPAEVAPQAPVPDLVTKALPITLHGLAAARGKFSATFTSGIVAPCDVQIPPSAVLPLRPLIVFGPAPAPPAPASPAPARQAAPVDPAPVQPAPVEAAPAQAKPEPPRSEGRGKTSVVPAPKPAPIKRQPALEPPAPKVAARTAPVESKPAVELRSAAEPKVEYKPAPEPERFRPSAPSDDMPSLRMEGTESAWSKLSVGVKIGVAAGLIAAIAGIAYVVTRGNGKTVTEAPAAAQAPAAVATGVPISGGWIEDWANVAKSNRRISLLSGSVKLSDYRMEFQAQIETKAVGWVFRGLNARNYYVAKLETVKPGLEPTVALVHFAVVDGHDENRVSVPLPMKLRVDTTYKIRFEAMGTHFSTWVQGQKIDEWIDNRFGSGGVGLFSEREEHAALQGVVNVVPLVSR